MATRPGSLFERRADRAVPGFPTDTGTAFFAGLAETGPTDAAVRCDSFDDYVDTFGGRASTAATLSDSVEAFFGEGGSTAWVARVDDATTPDDADWAAALALFAYNLGPGQIAAPGRTTTTAHQQLLDAAVAGNRTALLDAPFEETKANLITLAAAVDDATGAERAGLFAQWLQVPDAVAGTDRFVPPSPVVAGLCARSDVVNDAGRQPIADNGRLQYAIAAANTFSDADGTDLYEDAAVNVFLDDPLGLRLYGFRSVTTDDRWYELNANRLFMAFEARSRAQDEAFIGRRINSTTIGDYGAAKEALALEFYSAGALYGTTPEESFQVVTASPVNTAATAQARELAAHVFLRVAESVEIARTVTVKVPVTTTV